MLFLSRLLLLLGLEVHATFKCSISVRRHWKILLIVFIFGWAGLDCCTWAFAVVNSPVCGARASHHRLPLVVEAQALGPVGPAVAAPRLERWAQCASQANVHSWHVGSSQSEDRTVSPALGGGSFASRPPKAPCRHSDRDCNESTWVFWVVWSFNSINSPIHELQNIFAFISIFCNFFH